MRNQRYLREESRLDDLPGIVWQVDRDGLITDIGEKNWNAFYVQNRLPVLSVENVIGRAAEEFISGDKIREYYRTSAQNILSGATNYANFEYRCDSPEIERALSLTLYPHKENGFVDSVIFQSQILTERVRPSFEILSLIDQEPEPTLEPVKICSFCHDVRWWETSRLMRWMSPVHYYRLGGTNDVQLEMDICPNCMTRPSSRLASGIIPIKATVRVCSSCQHVVWPMGASDEEGEWISPSHYYALGGTDTCDVSHCLCPECSG